MATKLQEKFESGEYVGGLFVIWGDGPSHDLDRYECVDNTDALPDSALAWWKQAEQPWCITIDVTSKQREWDIIQTCDCPIRSKATSCRDRCHD